MDVGMIFGIWFVASILMAIGLNTYTKNSYDYEFLDNYPYEWIISCIIIVILSLIEPKTSGKWSLYFISFILLIPPAIKNVQVTDYAVGILITFTEILIAPYYILYLMVIFSIVKKI